MRDGWGRMEGKGKQRRARTQGPPTQLYRHTRTRNNRKTPHEQVFAFLGGSEGGRGNGEREGEQGQGRGRE